MKIVVVVVVVVWSFGTVWFPLFLVPFLWAFFSGFVAS